MKKTILEKLGVKTADKLSATDCKKRAALLQKKVDSGRVPKKLLPMARYYAARYRWEAKVRKGRKAA